MQLDVALPIVRALADGVNPITGEAYPDMSPYAEPRTLRALFAAVDLMTKAVDKEKRKQSLPANFGKEWTAEEEAMACELFESKHSLKLIAERLKRTAPSVRLRLKHLGKLQPKAA